MTFGWSYPAGAADDANAPYNQDDPPCEVCGKWLDDPAIHEGCCDCPECPKCGEVGNPECYRSCGLVAKEDE